MAREVNTRGLATNFQVSFSTNLLKMQKMLSLALVALLLHVGPSLAKNAKVGRSCPMNEGNLIDDALFLKNSTECRWVLPQNSSSFLNLSSTISSGPSAISTLGASSSTSSPRRRTPTRATRSRTASCTGPARGASRRRRSCAQSLRTFHATLVCYM